ncbi:diguanylate cyclase/phosphodiesterase [Rhizobium sp. RU20A]|uniref:putative bifunctional diguanylate cyclase/phosphodiesterase n=1 Tax=Rhizobium sp. RU20A TaxID=1907412 RepID=UPI000956910A|nr:EAL domain-containing protein [Rhizobium sp. RU20A]SIR07526.1 diguanylate cyclase/phosphodiesterase [Rhizobium sp. RU20A]
MVGATGTPHKADASGLPIKDRLTGLGTLASLRDSIDSIAAERAADPAPFTIGLVNLDGFKPINDLFGPESGDDILCQVAERLLACVPDGASVMRTGGDEFAIVLPFVFERKSAEKVGMMLKEVLSAPFDIGDRHVRLSASSGFAIYPFAGAEAGELTKSAATALYRSKRRGRAQITVYSHEIAQEMRRATHMEQALRNAIIANEIDVHFQPIVEIATGDIVGFEALARWCDADLGYVSPAVFVPLAEERGFIDALSEALLRKAAEQAVSWPRHIFLSFNLSSAQLVDPATALNVLSIVNRAGLDPRRLDIEITETAVMADPDIAGRVLTMLRNVGCRISLDDFGTGQSSLGRLCDFTFDKVKIDRSFVSRLTAERSTEHIVRAIIDMCHGMNFQVVAEGIETAAEVDMLRRLGCTIGQGWYFGKAVDAVTARRLINDSATRQLAVG